MASITSAGDSPTSKRTFPNDIYQFTKKNWNTSLQEQFLQFYHGGELTDVTLLVEGRQFKCHKIILCASSIYFNAMLNSCFSESQKDEIEICDLSAVVFQDVLEYFYGGTISITQNNAEELLSISCMMHLAELKSACAVYLKSYLSIENCVEQIILAERFSVENLDSACFDLIVDNVQKLLECGTFYNLPAETVVKVLEHDRLMIKDEKQAAMAAVNWLKANLKEREKYVDSVFAAIRLAQLPPHFIKCTLMMQDVVLKNEGLMRKLQECIDCAAFGFPYSQDIKLFHPRLSTGVQHEVL